MIASFSGRARQILVFRVGQLGDTLLALPAISSIRLRHPEHRLVLLTERQPAVLGYVSSWDVLGPTGWFDDVMFYTPARTFLQKLITMISMAWRIRALQPEIVYDLAPERTERKARRDRFFFRRMAGIGDYRGGGFVRKPPRNTQGILPHVEPEWKRLLRIIDADMSSGDFLLSIPLAEQQRAQQELQHEGLDENARMLAVGLGSNRPATRWAQERFRELGLRLLARDSALRLLVVGGKADAVVGSEMCVAWGERAHNLAGRFSVYGSAAVLQRCFAYVGNDTGTMHLAAMVGTPCVALFSARNYPGEWEPFGTGHVILRHETECAGCMLEVCPYGNRCLSLISIEEVIVALEEIMLKNVSHC